ncbi:hypothetical protein N1851_017179 [Merluccius polli]|uniref:Uncharacterized protein n=1 Tax=Merluccius polli TaxID=89951 RepID=A0AA47MQR8_MERPO|nr:hypothetical protein N1851_017179 [Merluccius polli]
MTIAPRKERMSTRSDRARYSDKDKEEYKERKNEQSQDQSRDHHVRRRHLESSRMLETLIPSTIISSVGVIYKCTKS